mmetsp:Transcript_5440/g.9475  ORF Transcript_5440/g.9475 Transcript_5440/m.9475 type:complete len:232 (-) Transcript_5440:56-751(-)
MLDFQRALIIFGIAHAACAGRVLDISAGTLTLDTASQEASSKSSLDTTCDFEHLYDDYRTYKLVQEYCFGETEKTKEEVASQLRDFGYKCSESFATLCGQHHFFLPDSAGELVAKCGDIKPCLYFSRKEKPELVEECGNILRCHGDACKADILLTRAMETRGDDFPKWDSTDWVEKTCNCVLDSGKFDCRDDATHTWLGGYVNTMEGLCSNRVLEVMCKQRKYGADYYGLR